VVLLVVAAARARTGWWAMGIGLILGGAIGNLIDRLFSPPGFGVGHGSPRSPSQAPRCPR
jgi:signal peptidase II